MKRNYLVGEKIALVAMSETGKRLQCVSVVIGTLDGGPEVKIDSPAFREPPKLELAEMLIEEDQGSLRYSGEFAGAILIPNFLWVSP